MQSQPQNLQVYGMLRKPNIVSFGAIAMACVGCYGSRQSKETSIEKLPFKLNLKGLTGNTEGVGCVWDW